MSPLRTQHALLQSRLDRFTRLLHGVEGGDVRAVHRTRVATRRLRELLPVLQLDGHATGKLGRRLRRVTRRLGEVREMDVLLAVIDELQDANERSSRALGQVAGEIRRSRDEAQSERAGKTIGVELHRIARKLAGAAEKLKEEEDGRRREHGWRWAIEARVARRADTLKTAIADAGALYLPERLHAVRIALKKFRYAVEVAAEASAADRRAELRALKSGQNTLGRLHDLQVLVDRARRSQASLDTSDVATWREFDLLFASLESACRRLHARYVRERSALVAICARQPGKQTRAKLAAMRRAG